MEAYEAKLENICQGGVKEAIEIVLQRIWTNICDVNTSAKKKRKLVFTVEFTPFPDRSGAMITTECESKLGQLDTSAITGSVYFAKKDGKVIAFTRDVRQTELFFAPESEEKTA